MNPLRNTFSTCAVFAVKPGDTPAQRTIAFDIFAGAGVLTAMMASVKRVLIS